MPDITLLGASYPDVSGVELPKTGGGTAVFPDTSTDTVTESDVLVGKTFHKSSGASAVGTLGTATQSTDGLMSAADKAKLDGVETGAQAHKAPTSSEVTTALGFTPMDSALKGAASGVAELDAGGLVPSTQLPSYVDDVLEYATLNDFPATGETGKIYVATSTNITYRWSGSAYVAIGSDLALGETSSTAYRGDRGAAAYAHAVTNKGSAFASGLYKVATNSEGHVTGATAVQKSDITDLGIPAQDTTYSAATPSTSGVGGADGLMAATDKEKLNGIEAGAQVNPGTATTSAAGLMSAADKTTLDETEQAATDNAAAIAALRESVSISSTSYSNIQVPANGSAYVGWSKTLYFHYMVSGTGSRNIMFVQDVSGDMYAVNVSSSAITCNLTLYYFGS